MKKVLTLTLLLALPVAADEPAKKTEPQKPAAQGTVLTPPAAAEVGDSPLVAASKRANRKGKKATNVITNETLKQPKKAHITTTTNPGPASGPVNSAAGREAPLPNPKVTAAEKTAADNEAKKKKEAAQARLAAAAAAAESDYSDPAYAEAELAAAAKEAEKAGEKKPPQQ